MNQNKRIRKHDPKEESQEDVKRMIAQSGNKKPKLNPANMVGMKIFKENEEDIELYRVIGTRGSKIKVRNEADGEESYNIIDDFEGFSPLGADGYLTFNIVTIKDPETKQEEEDVIVTCSKVLELENGITFPYAICRQSITDIFYNLLCTNESEQIVGLSINRDDCPTNFDIGLMLACSSIKHSESLFFYREDTLEYLLDNFVNSFKYDKVLAELYNGHLKHEQNTAGFLKKEDKGWCKDLKTLLAENSFQNDMNEMLGITDVMFDMKDYLVQAEWPNGMTYDTVVDDLKVWLAGTFRVHINRICVFEYNHDINLGDYNNALYFFLRDVNDTLWFCVYTVDGQYPESELQEQYEKLDVSDRYRLKFYNKYNNYDKK